MLPEARPWFSQIAAGCQTGDLPVQLLLCLVEVQHGHLFQRACHQNPVDKGEQWHRLMSSNMQTNQGITRYEPKLESCTCCQILQHGPSRCDHHHHHHQHSHHYLAAPCSPVLCLCCLTLGRLSEFYMPAHTKISTTRRPVWPGVPQPEQPEPSAF
jgi:hypothetical protein